MKQVWSGRSTSFWRMLICLATVGFVSAIFAGQKKEVYLSPLALAADKEGKTLYVAEATANQVAVMDINTGTVKSTIPLREPPSGLVLSPDGTRLYVTGGLAEGTVSIIDLSKQKIVGRIRVGHTPVGPVVSPDGRTLYVCNRFNNDVAIVDLISKRDVSRIRVLREPIADAVTADGKFLFAANHLPAGPSDGAYSAAAVSVIDTATRKVATTIGLPNGSTGVRDICISPDGRYAYVTHILARYQLPTTQLDRGWMNTNALSIIDVRRRKYVNTVLLDDVDLGAANPWGVTCTPDGKYVCVSQTGTHEITIIDREQLHDKLEKLATGRPVSDVSRTAGDVPNDLSFLVGLKRRLELAGKGPRGIVVVGSKVYTAEYFTDTIGVVDYNAGPRSKARSLPLGKPVPMTIVRKGEMIFHDASGCFQQWQSCSSCHPDGRSDGLNWDLLNDGIGNPKNTKSLLLSHRTPPVMSMGVRDRAETAVRAGIRHIEFALRPEADAAAIDEYLKSLEPVPSPYLVKGGLSAAARRGEKVFEKAGCARCHPPPLFTDMKKHDVGTGKGLDKGREFDTPTLVEVWRSAPYLHDGRAASMKEIFSRFNSGDKHGATSALGDKEIDDLVEFVLSR